ncbi:MAG: hypothetical protein IKX88_08500 [Thermoguttaceae bacterium]|nr:hypothetical protein [Thermoguttaceae bacterium]
MYQTRLIWSIRAVKEQNNVPRIIRVDWNIAFPIAIRRFLFVCIFYVSGIEGVGRFSTPCVGIVILTFLGIKSLRDISALQSRGDPEKAALPMVLHGRQRKNYPNK